MSEEELKSELKPLWENKIQCGEWQINEQKEWILKQEKQIIELKSEIVRLEKLLQEKKDLHHEDIVRLNTRFRKMLQEDKDLYQKQLADEKILNDRLHARIGPLMDQIDDQGVKIRELLDELQQPEPNTDLEAKMAELRYMNTLLMRDNLSLRK